MCFGNWRAIHLRDVQIRTLPVIKVQPHKEEVSAATIYEIQGKIALKPWNLRFLAYDSFQTAVSMQRTFLK